MPSLQIAAITNEPLMRMGAFLAEWPGSVENEVAADSRTSAIQSRGVSERFWVMKNDRKENISVWSTSISGGICSP